MNNNEQVYIVAAARTPIGNFNGSLSKLKASDLGAVVIKEVLTRANVASSDVDEVIMGQTLTAGQGQNPARQAALLAEIPIGVPAYNINMLCGSGLKTVVLGSQAIRCGDAKIIISGGQESMSRAPHVTHMRQGLKMGTATLTDSMLYDGLTDAMHNIHMGITGENLAERYSVGRREQDEFAVRSQNKADEAQRKGYFDNEIVPVVQVDGKGAITLDRDEFVKKGCKIEDIEELKPCFKENGTITPGNASGINDSASAVLLISAGELAKRSLKAMARIVAWAESGVEPVVMGIGPVTAVEAVLVKANWSKDDVDLFELNEASAAQAIAVLKELDVPDGKVNIHGGSIALGHPIAASGNRILVTLLYALQRTGGRKGVASLCIGGGMGIAMAIERV